MDIFQAEIDLGISDLIKNNYISYASSIKQFDKIHEQQTEEFFKTLAGKNPQQTDLLYRNAILASVGWNKNDDIFDKLEMLKAKDTPVDKQVNFMHNELDIIGHMIDSIVLGQDGKEVVLSAYGFCPKCGVEVKYRERCNDGRDTCQNDHIYPSKDSVSNVPDLFDIGVGFCVYKQWESPERKALVANVIDQIDSGKWFVSMECRFPRFDYAVMDSKGSHKVIERNEKSSFLSKFLKAYGGSGEYQGYRIGRLLRDFYFTGKGIVDNPANERSIIYGEKPEKFISVGSLNVKELNMDLEKQVAELKEKLDVSEKQIKAMSETNLAVAEIKKSHVTELEVSKTEYKTLSERLKEVEASLAIKVETVTKGEDDNTKLIAKLNEAGETILTLGNKVKEFSDAAHKATRISALVSKGVDKDEAEKVFAKWININDEQFQEIVELHTKSAMSEKMKEQMENKKEEKTETKDEEKKEDKKETAKADFTKAELDKGSEELKLDEDTKKDSKSLAAALMDVLPHAAKAKSRQEQTK